MEPAALRNGGSRIMNTYVYPGPAGWVMVDTGYAGSLRRTAERLRRQGVTLSEIRCVFLTHAHDDHAGFLNELLTCVPGMRVILWDKAMPVLLRGQNPFAGGCSGKLARFFCGVMLIAGKGEHRFPPLDRRHLDRLLMVSPGSTAEAEALLGGEILFTPGHTSDSISLKIPCGRGSILFCGDAAMNGLPSRKRITIWMEDQAAFRRSWDVLLASGAEWLYPAHGRPFPVRDLERYRDQVECVRLYPLRER